MKKINDMKNLFKALAAFQQEVPIIHKDAKGYNYSYTNIATIVEKITPLLKKHGLGYSQPLTENGIQTIIFHAESGESLESFIKLPIESLEYVEITKKDKSGNDYIAYQILGFEGMNKAQAYGSLITYFRRYSLSSILGLITDSDADARNKRIEKANEPKPECPEDQINKALDAIAKGSITKQNALKALVNKFDLTVEQEKNFK